MELRVVSLAQTLAHVDGHIEVWLRLSRQPEPYLAELVKVWKRPNQQRFSLRIEEVRDKKFLVVSATTSEDATQAVEWLLTNHPLREMEEHQARVDAQLEELSSVIQDLIDMHQPTSPEE